MQKSFWIALLPCLLFITGCSRAGKVVAQESGASLAYESLGALVVKEKAKDLWDMEVKKVLVEAATLSMADTGTRADMFRQALSTRLAESARKKYGAHAVINVTYWPDPGGNDFPEGEIFARGEMIRYTNSTPGSASTMKS